MVWFCSLPIVSWMHSFKVLKETLLLILHFNIIYTYINIYTHTCICNCVPHTIAKISLNKTYSKWKKNLENIQRFNLQTEPMSQPLHKIKKQHFMNVLDFAKAKFLKPTIVDWLWQTPMDYIRNRRKRNWHILDLKKIPRPCWFCTIYLKNGKISSEYCINLQHDWHTHVSTYWTQSIGLIFLVLLYIGDC